MCAHYIIPLLGMTKKTAEIEVNARTVQHEKKKRKHKRRNYEIALAAQPTLEREREFGN